MLFFRYFTIYFTDFLKWMMNPLTHSMQMNVENTLPNARWDFYT